MSHNLFNTRQSFSLANGKTGTLYSLQALETAGLGKISRLPVSIRIVLEAVLRNYDDKKINENHIRQLANWQQNSPRTEEIPFVVARIVLQDFTGIPLLVDLATMRDAAAKMNKNPMIIEPLVPVDLVVDHSVQVDYYNSPDALQLNMELEFERNNERYKFMKWGMQAFDTFKVVPPGIGIVHQVNLEYLARGVLKKDGIYYPDTLVGTDSHTTMINGIGVVGWGVGGIEAEAGMLGQPVYFLTPDVVGVHLTGKLREGITATDLVLAITELLRKHKVVGKFVEFFGAGTAALTLPDRTTLANMAPEYGATMGFFPVDDVTSNYLRNTGRSDEEVDAFQSYFKAQGLYGIPEAGAIDYSSVVELDLNSIQPSLAGPKRPQDRVPLSEMKENFNTLFSKSVAENGFNQPAENLEKRYITDLADLSGNVNVCVPIAGGGRQDQETAPADSGTQSKHNTSTVTEIEMMDNRPTPSVRCETSGQMMPAVQLQHGDVLIAAITSCTNTSNPGVMLAAGLLAKKAVEAGLRVQPHIKTSLAPGSRVVTDYLTHSGLLPYLEQLGFRLVGYGCTTCIGNSGPLGAKIEDAILAHDLITAAVLSGNRNFEARVHANIKANFLASPPLVVAFALAGKVNINLESEPLGTGSNGQSVYLKDIWPSSTEIHAAMKFAADPMVYRKLYSDLTHDLPLWNAISAPTGNQYHWDDSTYIARPPFFDDISMAVGSVSDILNAKPLGIFGDSVTTDHISPAGSFKSSTPAGKYLQSKGVAIKDFNSYGARRGNHEVMIRGTFANVRIKNLMLPPNTDGSRVEGGYTLYNGKQIAIYDAAMEYIAACTPTVIFAGEEYGTGSSRDWAAKGTQLLGVKAVVAKSFERIHRSNLVGMGVLPLQFKGNDSVATLKLTGEETFDLTGIANFIKPQQDVMLTIKRRDGSTQQVTLLLRIDTPIEVDYYRHGGILPYVLRELVTQ
ncbi:aconitate hydratase 1 [Candidatus Nitrotoga sp. HW29]|uniref:aconitate hydratase n=1 Tax=Candidatus Nitrotoga sp. HW29 TaxID=2886963 RepID=UPI001EF37BB8|nr:aconitate hydratase [Candidatus Nitrotoga sp. HW29]CAH1904744.1 aconitate hydratase 1 [Candidatus Nitrotoga sp. HW29]